MMSRRSEIYKMFIQNDALVDEMKNCLHSNNDTLNPYHMESSVWCHTLMVFANADPNNIIEMIMALCHDIGKVITRKVKDDGRVTFYGHSDASIQSTIDFIDRLYVNDIITIDELHNFIDYGLPAMANHMLYYQNIHKTNMLSNGNEIIKKYLLKMAYMDSRGSICKGEKIDSKMDIICDEFTPVEIDSSLPNVYLWCGLPGSGKDYLAENFGNDTPIVSFDDIRVKLYKETHSTNGILEDEIYANAFKYCNDNNIDLNKSLRKEVQYYIKNNQDVSVCNTSLTRKARRSIINSISHKKCNIIVNQVFAPTNVIMERNNNRKSKTVPIHAIDRMMSHMTIATHFEKNVNMINYIYNR